MATPSKNFTAIADSAIDADSPLTEDLMTDIRDNDIHLEEWLGKDYTAATNHDHDGSNSARVAGASGGVNIAIGDHRSDGNANAVNQAMFIPECALYLDAEASSETYISNEVGDTIVLRSGSLGTGIEALQLGGAKLSNAGPGAAGARFNYGFFKSATDLVKVGKFTGDGTGSQVITVGFQAEFILVWEESGSGTNPTVRTTSMTGSNSKGLTNGTLYGTGITAISSTGFTVGSSLNGNTVGYMYLALKSGSLNGERVQIDNYTGTGADRDLVNTGGFIPQMVMLINTDSSSFSYSLVVGMIGMNSWAKRVNVTAINSGYFTITETGVRLSASATVNLSGNSYDIIYILGGNRPG